MPLPDFLHRIFESDEHKQAEHDKAAAALRAATDARTATLLSQGLLQRSMPRAERMHPIDHAEINQVLALYAPDVASNLTPTPETPMSTSPVPQPKKVSFLQHLGNILRTVLHIGEEAAVIAAPIVALKFPQIAPLYNNTLGLAVSAEATIGSTPGTGVQKLQAVAPQLIAQAQSWAKQNGVTWADKEITEWASAVVDTINRIPAPAPPTA